MERVDATNFLLDKFASTENEEELHEKYLRAAEYARKLHMENVTLEIDVNLEMFDQICECIKKGNAREDSLLMPSFINQALKEKIEKEQRI